MLSTSKKRENLAGKLLLTSALVVVSLAYGWWQRPSVNRPRLAMAPAPLPLPAKPPAAVPSSPAVASPAPVAPARPLTPDTDAGSVATENPDRATAEPQKPSTVAKAAPQAAPAAAPPPPEAPPQNGGGSSSSPSTAPAPPAPPQAILPADGSAPPPFLVTGTPDPAAKSPVPAGLHLQDGDYVSSRHELMWGELRIKIFVRGGLIAGVQAVQFPDHRSQSLYLSELALPTLESEVIKNQTSQVDTVSSATDTSYVFQDAVADAIVKATRGG